MFAVRHMQGDDEDEVDYFSYPDPNDYLTLVNNPILPLTTADKWRHEFAVLYRRSEKDVFRVVLKTCLFPGRCFDCKLTPKQLSFCFFGQEVSDRSTMVEQLPAAFVRRITSWKDLIQALGEDTTEPRGERFPDMDVMFPPKSLKRIPEQHMLPPLDPLLLQKPFSGFMSPTMFNAFLSKRQTFHVGEEGGSKRKRDREKKSLARGWTEPAEWVEARRENMIPMMNDTSEEITREDKMQALAEFMKLLLEQWGRSVCSAECNVPSGKCPACNALRSHLKKSYKEGVRDSCTKHVVSLLLNKEPPFSKAPDMTRWTGNNYEDATCRITRVMTNDA